MFCLAMESFVPWFATFVTHIWLLFGVLLFGWSWLRIEGWRRIVWRICWPSESFVNGFLSTCGLWRRSFNYCDAKCFRGYIYENIYWKKKTWWRKHTTQGAQKKIETERRKLKKNLHIIFNSNILANCRICRTCTEICEGEN